MGTLYSFTEDVRLLDQNNERFGGRFEWEIMRMRRFQFRGIVNQFIHLSSATLSSSIMLKAIYFPGLLTTALSPPIQ
jgi:hypothetical protein